MLDSESEQPAFAKMEDQPLPPLNIFINWNVLFSTTSIAPYSWSVIVCYDYLHCIKSVNIGILNDK